MFVQGALSLKVFGGIPAPLPVEKHYRDDKATLW